MEINMDWDMCKRIESFVEIHLMFVKSIGIVRILNTKGGYSLALSIVIKSMTHIQNYEMFNISRTFSNRNHMFDIRALDVQAVPKNLILFDVWNSTNNFIHLPNRSQDIF